MEHLKTYEIFVDRQGESIEPDDRIRYIKCIDNNNYESKFYDIPLTIGKIYEHIPDDAIIQLGGESRLRGAREMYYTVEDDNGEEHNYYKYHFIPATQEEIEKYNLEKKAKKFNI